LARDRLVMRSGLRELEVAGSGVAELGPWRLVRVARGGALDSESGNRAGRGGGVSAGGSTVARVARAETESGRRSGARCGVAERSPQRERACTRGCGSTRLIRAARAPVATLIARGGADRPRPRLGRAARAPDSKWLERALNRWSRGVGRLSGAGSSRRAGDRAPAVQWRSRRRGDADASGGGIVLQGKLRDCRGAGATQRGGLRRVEPSSSGRGRVLGDSCRAAPSGSRRERGAVRGSGWRLDDPCASGNSRAAG